MWAACSGSVYCVLTALLIVKVSDIIPLYMAMKQLNEDSISQAVYMAMSVYKSVVLASDQLMLPRLECTRRPATFSAPGRGEGAKGSKGSEAQERNSCWKRPRPQTWEG